MANSMERLLAAKTTAVRTFLGGRPPQRTSFVALLASGHPDENVVGVGVGAKIVKGKPTRKPSVRFYVKRKIGRRALAASMLLPTAIDGIPTDVVETGPFRAQPRGAPAAAASGAPREQRKLRPARPGCSVGFQFTGNMANYVMAGTFGALVEKEGRRYILSNNHVLANENALQRGAPIFQPGLLDGGNPASDQIAQLSDFIPLVAGGPNDVDAAIAELLPRKKLATRVFLPKLGRLKSADPLNAEEGMPVAKVGRTTSYTTGAVFDVSADVRVEYELGVVVFRNQILVVPDDHGSFSDSGDSGSLIVHRRKEQPVALLFAGSDTHTIGTPIERVLQAFGVTIVA